MKNFTCSVLLVLSGLSGYAQCEGTEQFDEDFEATAVPALPACWTSILRGEGISANAKVKTVGFFSPSGSGVRVMMNNQESPITTDIILVSPSLSNLSEGTHRLRLQAAGLASNVGLSVGTLDGTGDDAIFTIKEEITASTTVSEFIVDFMGYAGTDTHIGIRLSSQNPYVVAVVDDISWEAAPACPDVSEIVLDAVGIETAVFSWTAGGAETQWEAVCGSASVTDPTTLTAIQPAMPDASISIGGLTENTSYKVWVRSVCTGGNGEWIGPVAFKTACLPVTLFDENFDGAQTPALPSCWTSMLRGEGLSESADVKTIGFFSLSGNAVLLTSQQSSTSSDIMLVSPGLGNLSAGTNRLKLHARGLSSDVDLAIGTLDTSSSQAIFTVKEEITAETGYAEFIIDFTDYVGTDDYIAIRLSTADGYASAIVDEISWEPAPACPDVSALAVTTIDAQAASISWSPGGSETQWEAVYDTADLDDPASLSTILQALPDASVTITGLAASTSYNAWIRSVCDAGSGSWIGPVTFTTACLSVTSFSEDFDAAIQPVLPACWTAILSGPTLESAFIQASPNNQVSGSNSVQLYNSTASIENDNILLVSPNIANLASGTHRLRFWAKGPGALQIGTLAGNSNAGLFNVFQEVETTVEYTQVIVDFSSYSGTESYIGIRHNASPALSSIYLDNIIWEAVPSCPDVSDIAVDLVTSGSAEVSWFGGNGETGWNVAYSEATIGSPEDATPVGTPLQDATIMIGGLVSNTTYNVWVRSTCGMENGAWIGPVVFTTSCSTAYSIDENFESAMDFELPGCWSRILRGPTVAPDADVSVNTNQGNSAFNAALLYNSNSNDSTDDIILVSPVLGNLADGLHELTFSAKGASCVLEIGTLSDGTDEAIFTVLDTVEMTDAYQGFTIDFSGYAGTDALIGIRHKSIYTFINAYVDDFKWQPVLSVGEHAASGFSYRPNPVRDFLNISAGQGISEIAIFNMAGQKVYDHEHGAALATARIDLSDLAAGSYIVKATSDTATHAFKIVKE